MAEQLQPDQIASTIAAFDQRLRTLEGASRVGLNRIRYAWATGTPQTTLVYDAFDYGPVTATWQDDRGNTGTGYPRVTVAHGKKALFLVQGYAQQIANDVTFKTYQWFLGAYGVGVPSIINPLMYRFQTHGPTTEGNNTVSLITARADMVPGSYLYAVMAQFTKTNVAAANEPKLADPFIAVLPID